MGLNWQGRERWHTDVNLMRMQRWYGSSVQ